jgi:pimeloyl-ACP methyl ester carboxylesterase
LLSQVAARPAAEVQGIERSRLGSARTLNLPDALVYLPAHLRPDRTYPMVAAFTPHGEVQRTFNRWKAVGERFHWIIYASNQYSNQSAEATTDFNQYGHAIAASVEAALSAFPVDRSRVVLAGFSGGGFFAEYLNSQVPNLGAALVVAANGLYASGDDPEYPFPTGANSASRRMAAFLYSPTDREFGEMTRLDRTFYQRHHWSTTLLSYPGGHVDPPQDTCLRAAAWIVAQRAWHRSK